MGESVQLRSKKFKTHVISINLWVQTVSTPQIHKMLKNYKQKTATVHNLYQFLMNDILFKTVPKSSF